KKQKRHFIVLDDLPPSSHPSVDPAELDNQRMRQKEKERMLDCMEYCLNNLPVESRDLLIEYYKEEKRGRINNRNLMAKNMGIDVTTLRNRVMRIREKLQKCVTTCSCSSAIYR